MHFDRSGDADRAILYLEQAGTSAIGRKAPREAIRHLGRAIERLAALPETSARAERELSLHVALGSQLTPVHGSADSEVERVYARIRELCGHTTDTARLFPALWGLWHFAWHRGEVAQARTIAEDLVARAERTGDAALLLQARHALWPTLLSVGEVEATHEHAAAGIALYEMEAHAPLASAFGNHDAGVCARNADAWALALLGFPDRARNVAADAIALAERLGHPFDVAIAHLRAAVIHQERREPNAMRARAEIAMGLAREHAFGLIVPQATGLLGWVLASEGRHEDGIAALREATAPGASAGTEQYQGYLLALLADACLMALRAAEGLAVVAEALHRASATGERLYEAELRRLRGELLLGSGREMEAEPCLLEAVEVARRQRAKWLELRATVSLGRLRRQQGRAGEAGRLLSGVLGGFTEGLETAHVCEARALLAASRTA
jgi:predicted ATPase